MDQQYTSQSLLDLEIDPMVSRSFHDATRWARFIAIVYSIFLGLFLIVLLALLASATFYQGFMTALEESPIATMLGGMVLIVFGVGAAVGVVLLVLLFRFVIYTRNGLITQEQSVFHTGLRALKNYLLIQGILSLLYFVLMLIATVSGLFMTNV